MKQKTPRRREVRRNVQRQKRSWRKVWRDRGLTWALTYALLLTVVGATLSIAGRYRQSYAEGEFLAQPVVARLAFEAEDEAATEQARKDARLREPARYVARTDYLDKLKDNLIGLVTLGEKESLDQIAQDTRDSLQLTPQAFEQLQRINNDTDAVAAWRTSVGEFMTSLQSIAVLSDEDARREKNPKERAPKIMIQQPGFGWRPRPDTLVYSVDADAFAVRESLKTIAKPYFHDALRDTVVAAVLQDKQPYYQLDSALTKTERIRSGENEEPVLTEFRKGQEIIPANTKVTANHLALLKEERAYYNYERSTWAEILEITGQVGFMAVIAAALWVYVFAYKERIARNPMRGLALTLLLLGGQAFAVGATYNQPQWVYFTAVLPTLLAAAVIAIAYDQRFALGVGALLTLIIAVSLELPLSVMLTMLVGVGVAVAMLREVRTSTKLVLVGAASGTAMAVTTFVVGLSSSGLQFLEEELRVILMNAMIAWWAGFLCGMLVQAVLPVIERLFKVTTAARLKELNDASLPLLRRLAQEAPGTYQHSLNIAHMAEAAADAIGADGLLCKVGAMYHDIGKINKPSYFVENQGGGPNRHNKLSPAMSLLIIVGHVKDGMEMAREYGLPKVLRHFIESHHGTTLVEYFYHAAKQQRAGENEPAPQDFEFRYPGPKPQTREAAILMLCDGVEGAARSMTEPNPVRLEQLVHTMAEKRLMDGQFDECHVTLKELHQIEMAVTRTLCAIYHGRIKYPTDKYDDDEAPAAASTGPVTQGSAATAS